MNLHDRILRLAKALPSDKASVTLTRADLIALLEDSPPESESITRDLTVEEVAAEVGRAPFYDPRLVDSGQATGLQPQREELADSALRAARVLGWAGEEVRGLPPRR